MKMIAPKNPKLIEDRREDRGRIGSVAPQVERDDGLLGPRLDEQEDQAEREPDEDQAADDRVGPLVESARRGVGERLVGQADEQRADGHREHAGAEEVDVAAGVRALDRGQQPGDDGEADDADRDVDVEDPVPAERVGQEATERRAEQGGDAEHGAEQALVLAALLGGEQVADDRQRDREQRAGAEALDAPEQDQLLHGLRQPGQALNR